VGTNLIIAMVDPLNRRTEYTYDSTGRVLTTTRMAGTSEAATTTYTYEPAFHQLATVTDPLQHTWTLGYNAQARLSSSSDPLSHQSTIVLNGARQVTSVTDPLTHQWQTGYLGGDQVSTTNLLGAVSEDPIGLLGGFNLFAYVANNPTGFQDPLGLQIRTPAQGQPPNSTRWHANPDGSVTRRYFGPDGRALQDMDLGQRHGHDPDAPVGLDEEPAPTTRAAVPEGVTTR
jgi:YD repeat-containing protein